MITTNTKATYALKAQKKVGIFDYPFTLNPFIGCEMQCKYCFVPGPVIKTTRKDFFENVQVKSNLVDLLKKDLNKYSALPQHLKRVQIGVTTELFQPKVISYLKKTLKQDLILQILEVFKSEWKNYNKWMLHILTKNHNIVSYINELKDMKEMIQVEFSMIHHDDSISRSFEKYTSSISRRISTIDKLSKEGIFVRVMAMPFYGSNADLKKLKDLVFNNGAQAFKNKSLNYYDWNQFPQISATDDLKRTTVKNNSHVTNMIIKSGEEISPQSIVKASLPKAKKRGDKFINWSIHPKTGLEKIDVPKIDMGYSNCNQVDWKYIV